MSTATRSPISTTDAPKIDIDWWRPDLQRLAPSWVRACRPRVIRGMRQFAEEEIVLSTGEYGARHFRCDRQPFVKLWFDELTNEYWREYAGTGPSQSGKTLAFFAIPIMYYLFERREDVIAAVPTLEMCEDKWSRDLLPFIERSRYKDLMPDRKGGSRGGFATRIDFKNGVSLKWMTPGGGDKSKAGYTARVVVFTELDGFRGLSTSDEANPIEQILARQRSFARSKRIVIKECTVTFEDGPIWTAVTKTGSNARIMTPCPRCGEYVTLERENLKGWDQATNEVEVEELTAWHCSHCDAPWTENERYDANDNAKLIHGEQTIDRDGNVSGELPPTRQLGFRYSAVNNMLLPAIDIGYDLFKARASEDEVDSEKKVCQFVFATPYQPPDLGEVKFDRATVESRRSLFTRSLPPESTRFITIGMDVNKHHCHWTAIAFTLDSPRLCHVIDYGILRLRIEQGGKKLGPNELGFARCFTENVMALKARFDEGWVDGKGEIHHYDSWWIDSRWQGEEHDGKPVYAWAKACGDPRIRPAMGQSANQFKPSKYREPSAKDRNVIRRGPGYHIHFDTKIKLHVARIDVDQWKLNVQQGWTKGVDTAGALILFDSKNPREHAEFVKHMDSEVVSRTFEQGKGLQEKWNRIREGNHWLDATVYARVAGHACGFRENPAHDVKKRRPSGIVRPVQGPGGRNFNALRR